MKTKFYVGISVLILVSLVLTACGGADATPTSAPSPVVPTLGPATATPTNVPVVNTPTASTGEAPKSNPTQPAGQPVVVTATGMADIGQLLGVQPMTPVPGDLIDWDHLAKMEEWKQLPGVAKDITVLYAQSGVPNKIEMPTMPGAEDSRVPIGSTLIIGGYNVSLKVNGKAYSITGGFLGAFTEGTKVTDVVIEDGFAAMARRDDGKREYCARVAQAMNQKWAPFDGKQEVNGHLYRPSIWEDPVCEGVYTTPLDNDRPPVTQ